VTVFPLADGRLLAIVSASGPSSYSSGGFEVTVSELRVIEKVIAVYSNGGYLCEPGAISKNTVKVVAKWFKYSSSSDGVAEEPTGQDLSGTTFTVVVIGF